VVNSGRYLEESMAYRIAKSLGKLRSQANSRWPGRNKASDGWIGDPAHFARGKASDHNPHVRDGSTGVVTALDLTHDPKSGCDTGVLTEVLIASRDPRIKYIIWNKRIVSGDAGPSPWVRRKYNGSNPHTMHVHISVKGTKARYDNDAAWALPGAAPPATPSAPPPPAGVEKRETIKKRSKRAEDVRYLQKLLGITVNGVFGSETEEAVKKAQKENGLLVDGIVGPYTWAALMK
jgi:hypothetical protein